MKADKLFNIFMMIAAMFMAISGVVNIVSGDVLFGILWFLIGSACIVATLGEIIHPKNHR